MKITLKLMDDASEIIQSYLPNVSIGIQRNKLSYFDGMRALCHWHKDIELIKVLDGEMNYYVNGRTYHLNKGDGLIINSKAMHYGYSKNHKECEFICVLIDPDILGENSLIYKNIIYPIISTSSLDVFTLNSRNNAHIKILDNIDNLAELYIKYISAGEDIDLECIAISCYFWKNFFNLIKEELIKNQPESKEIHLQKQMTRFIYQNYMHPIKLENIADSANICRSKCCILFKKYAQQSPINFLNEYRINKVKELIINTNMSITEIALSCGFNHLSYFSKQFYKVTGKTPKVYRVDYKISGNLHSTYTKL